MQGGEENDLQKTHTLAGNKDDLSRSTELSKQTTGKKQN